MNLKLLSEGGRMYRLIAIIFLLTTICRQMSFAQNGFVVDEIVSKVDNYVVLKSDVDRAYQEYITNGGTASQEARCHFLAQLIRNKLMMAKAEIDSLPCHRQS